MNKHNFKVDDELEVIKSIGCGILLNTGSRFAPARFETHKDKTVAFDAEGRWADVKSLKLVKPATEEKIYWDGKEELQVGMWVSVFGELERRVEMLDDVNFAYYNELGSIRTRSFNEVSPIKTHKQKWIKEYKIGSSENCDLDTRLSEFYDKAREGM